MPDTPQDEPTGVAIVVDGQEVTIDDLTFKEQRQVRTLIRELNDDATLETDDATLMDLLPALVTVIKQRSDAGYSMDQALEMRPTDVLQEQSARPTKPAKTTRSTGGRTGTRATS